MNLSTVKWAQWDKDKTQSRELLVLFCAQLLHTILRRTDLIIFPLTLQTITWGKGGGQSVKDSYCNVAKINVLLVFYLLKSIFTVNNAQGTAAARWYNNKSVSLIVSFHFFSAARTTDVKIHTWEATHTQTVENSLTISWTVLVHFTHVIIPVTTTLINKTFVRQMRAAITLICGVVLKRWVFHMAIFHMAIEDIIRKENLI